MPKLGTLVYSKRAILKRRMSQVGREISSLGSTTIISFSLFTDLGQPRFLTVTKFETRVPRELAPVEEAEIQNIFTLAFNELMFVQLCAQSLQYRQRANSVDVILTIPPLLHRCAFDFNYLLNTCSHRTILPVVHPTDSVCFSMPLWSRVRRRRRQEFPTIIEQPQRFKLDRLILHGGFENKDIQCFIFATVPSIR